MAIRSTEATAFKTLDQLCKDNSFDGAGETFELDSLKDSEKYSEYQPAQLKDVKANEPESRAGELLAVTSMGCFSVYR